MSQILKGLVYLIFTSLALWVALLFFSVVIGFSYTDNILSWIPYIIFGGWVPGKLYELTLVHCIVAVAINQSIIGWSQVSNATN